MRQTFKIDLFHHKTTKNAAINTKKNVYINIFVEKEFIYMIITLIKEANIFFNNLDNLISKYNMN